MRSSRAFPVVLGFFALQIAVACTRPPARGPGQPLAAAEDPGGPGELGRLHALLINGGGSADQNYQSHLLHLRELTRALRDRGLSPGRISIFASDGADPAPDLAIRAVQPERDFWQLAGTRIERHLSTPIELTSSRVESMPLQPATESALRAWFGKRRDQLRSGDTLLLYVTDHGTRNDKDPRNNRISLWGRDADLTVDELGALLGRLDPGVRVVAVMSQCFSGGFARLYETRRTAGGPGGFCGYFSSTADRPAYGCYPENRDKDNVGYSFHLFEELARGQSLPAAHREVLTTDRTPDVPLRTSDVYLQDLLARAAAAAGQPLFRFTDRLLAEAWKDRKAWEPDIRLLDRVGKTFGMWSPRTLAELEEQARNLPDFSKSIAELNEAWSEGLEDLNVGRLTRFVEANPAWQPRLQTARLDRLPQAERRQLTGELLSALASFELRRDRLLALHERSQLAGALDYRMEVRTGALLRLRTLLAGVAGRVYLSKPGRDKERQLYRDLLACEDLQLPAEKNPRSIPEATPEPFPPFADDVKAAAAVVPTYMGIRFSSLAPEQQKRHNLPAGAAVIQLIYPESPAQKAGLLPGDVILGLPGQPFTLHNEVRVWTYFASAGTPQPLEVLRGAQRQQIVLVPTRRPGQLPSLPEPPRDGISAPALSLTPFRGAVPARLDGGSPHLLFFWGTFCGPCKASLPEVLAFSKTRGVPVVAITDEPQETVSGFFSGWKQPFPANVALDELRRTFIAYGVNGVPTFVLVDGQGKVTSHRTGYDPAKGLDFPGWQRSR